MKSPEEHGLAEYFETLRSVDRKAVTPFDAVLAASRRPRHEISRAPLRWAMAAALIAVGAVVALRVPMAPRHSVQPSLADWSSPTAFLLETPGKAFLVTMPRIDAASGIGGALPLPTVRNRKDRSK